MIHFVIEIKNNINQALNMTRRLSENEIFFPRSSRRSRTLSGGSRPDIIGINRKNTCKRSRVPRFRFASDGIFDRIQRSAPPLATEVASLIKKVTLA
jgi:hypothetical protein